MRKFVFTAIVLGFTNVFVAMTQQQNSPISLYNNNNGVETFTTYEVDGVNYHFLTKEDFIARVEKNDFLEYANVHGNMYGTPKFKVEEMLAEGKNVILEIDIQGALKVKENFSEGVFIFILPPSMEELKHRIIKRGSETEESLMTRFKNAYQEINYVSKYNYAVVNDEVDTAVTKIEGIIAAEKCRVDRIKDTILDSKEGLIHEQLYD